jgi:hypothetical protein
MATDERRSARQRRRPGAGTRHIPGTVGAWARAAHGQETCAVTKEKETRPWKKQSRGWVSSKPSSRTRLRAMERARGRGEQSAGRSSARSRERSRGTRRWENARSSRGLGRARRAEGAPAGLAAPVSRTLGRGEDEAPWTMKIRAPCVSRGSWEPRRAGISRRLGGAEAEGRTERRPRRAARP